jgi:hypothetical protein
VNALFLKLHYIHACNVERKSERKYQILLLVVSSVPHQREDVRQTCARVRARRVVVQYQRNFVIVVLKCDQQQESGEWLYTPYSITCR